MLYRNKKLYLYSDYGYEEIVDSYIYKDVYHYFQRLEDLKDIDNSNFITALNDIILDINDYVSYNSFIGKKDFDRKIIELSNILEEFVSNFQIYNLLTYDEKELNYKKIIEELEEIGADKLVLDIFKKGL